MAAKDASETHPATSQNTTGLDGFVGVLRASRMEAAEALGHDISHEPVIERKGPLIEPDEGERCLSEHRRRIRPESCFVNETMA